MAEIDFRARQLAAELGLELADESKKVTEVLDFGDAKSRSGLHKAYQANLHPVMQYFNNQLMQGFNPDINGYTLAFLVPPPFKFLPDAIGRKEDFLNLVAKLVSFAAIDFSPPQRQVNSSTVSGRTGGIPYATEVLPTEQASITYIDNQALDIFNFHYMWVEYIRELLEGVIEIDPKHEYLQYDDASYGALDYAGSLFIAKYSPNMGGLKYLGKCTGVYPQSLPSKELIGTRAANELTTLPYTYFSGFYEEAMDKHHPIYKEFVNVLTRFDSENGLAASQDSIDAGIDAVSGIA